VGARAAVSATLARALVEGQFPQLAPAQVEALLQEALLAIDFVRTA
jgi:hypothetical protein